MLHIVRARWELSGTQATHSTGGCSAESPQGWARIKGTLTCFLGAQQVSENNVCGVKTVRSAAGGEQSENEFLLHASDQAGGALVTGETSQSKHAAPAGLLL